jgi:hypothetical protein
MTESKPRSLCRSFGASCVSDLESSRIVRILLCLLLPPGRGLPEDIRKPVSSLVARPPGRGSLALLRQRWTCALEPFRERLNSVHGIVSRRMGTLTFRRARASAGPRGWRGAKRFGKHGGGEARMKSLLIPGVVAPGSARPSRELRMNPYGAPWTAARCVPIHEEHCRGGGALIADRLKLTASTSSHSVTAGCP